MCINMIASRSIKVPKLKKYGTKASLTLRAVDLCVPKAGPISVEKPGQGQCLSTSLLIFGRRCGMKELQCCFICLGHGNQGSLIGVVMCGDQKVADDFACYHFHPMSLL